MTASAERRRRTTIVGALGGLAGVVAVVIVAVVAYSTLRNSEEGRAPEIEVKDSLSFPSTPNAVIGVVDDLDRLTSIAVLTLDPSGIGGSIVTIPVNSDRTNGFASERLPISRQPYTPGDEEQEAQLMSELEPLLTLTIERSAVVGPDGLAELLDAVGPMSVDVPERVVDVDTPGSGLVVREGEQRLDVDELVDVFTAIDAEGSSYSHHGIDVALWRAIAAAAGDVDVDVPVDEFERPIAPDGFDEFWSRLLAGEVAMRDLAINANAASAADNETEADFVIVDRRDALLVFGSVSPGLVSKPNESLTFSLRVGFDEGAVGRLGEDAAGSPITKASMTRRFLGEMLFAQANIVAVDLSETPGSVPDVTRIEVADERLEDDVRDVSERFFGDAEIVVAATIIDGVDAVVVLGADFLEQRAELLEIERQQAAAVDRDDGRDDEDADDDGADFDVADAPLIDEAAAVEGAADLDETANDENPDADSVEGDEPPSTDTVPDDE